MADKYITRKFMNPDNMEMKMPYLPEEPMVRKEMYSMPEAFMREPEEFKLKENPNATMSIGEEIYKRIMSGDLDAPNIFSNESVIPQRPEPSLPNPAEMQQPKGRQSTFRKMLQNNRTPPAAPSRMPADFGRMTKNILMNRQQPMPQQMPQQRPNIYNNLGPGNQQMQQRPFTTINPFLMNRGF